MAEGVWRSSHGPSEAFESAGERQCTIEETGCWGGTGQGDSAGGSLVSGSLAEKQIQRDIVMLGPCMKRKMTFDKEHDGRHALLLELVTCLRKNGEAGLPSSVVQEALRSLRIFNFMNPTEVQQHMMMRMRCL